MKKIFLLSLLSVFFLSAFCQISSDIEVLTKINITRSADVPAARLASESHETVLDDFDLGWPNWWFLYKTVKTEKLPNGTWLITCLGNGWKACMPSLRIIFQMIFRGADQSLMESTCENLVMESEELAATGTYKGSITKKVAFPDSEANSRESYLLFQMNWNYCPENPYNGTAEIIISRTNRFGLR